MTTFDPVGKRAKGKVCVEINPPHPTHCPSTNRRAGISPDPFDREVPDGYTSCKADPKLRFKPFNETKTNA